MINCPSTWDRSWPLGLILLSMTLSTAWSGQQLLMIEGVRVLDGKVLSERQDLLIRDGRVEEIAEHTPGLDLALRLDAHEGVLLGALKTGAAANFVILRGNPLQDLSVLADTRAHTLLLFRDGQLVTDNTLSHLPQQGDDDAPPEAVPERNAAPSIVDEDGRRQATWDTGFWSGDVDGVLAISTQRFDQDDNSILQVGSLDEFERAEVTAARLGLSGYIGRDYSVYYYIDYGYNGFEEGFKLQQDDEWSLYNLEVIFPKSRLGTFTLGRMKAPESISRVMGGLYLPTSLRAVPINVLTASRDNGIRLTNTALDDRMTWGTGIYNDWLSHSGQGFGETNTYIVGRVTGLPVFADGGDHLLHLGLSARWTSMENESIRFRGKPGFSVGPDYLDTGDLEGKGARWLIGEFSWKKDNFLILAETVHTAIDSPTLGDPTLKGSYASAEWTLTGESRGYNQSWGIWDRPLPNSNFTTGGTGLWSVTASWSDTDLDDKGVSGGSLEEYILGVSWFPQKGFRWGIEIGRASLDRFNIRGKTTFAQFYLHVTTL